MELNGTIIEDEFAEAFRMWACCLVVTACSEKWVRIAANEVTGYGTSVIGCDAEAGVERWLPAEETPDGRPGASLMFFAFNAKALTKAMPNRVGQCLMTCPTTAVYDGMPWQRPRGEDDDDRARIEIGSKLRYFGDGNQRSKVVHSIYMRDAQRFWRVPVMGGEFVCEEAINAVKAIGGGNILITGTNQQVALEAAERAVNAIADIPGVITPFPGGVVRSGSKVGSVYKALFASTNDEYCPTVRSRVETKLRDGANTCFEIVINGLSETAIAYATRDAIRAAAGEGVVAISAGNYGGNLGKFHFRLHEVMKLKDPPKSSGNGGGTAVMQVRPIVLTWRDDAAKRFKAQPIDGSVIRPDLWVDATTKFVGAQPVRVGRETVALNELFDVTGDSGTIIHIRNAPPLNGIGSLMESGWIIIEGAVGDDLGASMKGGEIVVRGSAGARVGGPHATKSRGMTGGKVVITGDAGDYAGYRMRRGLVAIGGKAGKSPGYQMIAGTLVVVHGPYDAPGLEMNRGSIVLLDRDNPIEANEGFGKDGEFDAASMAALQLMLRNVGEVEVGTGGFPSSDKYETVLPIADEILAGRFALYSGDRFELNKGEVWQWVS